MIFHTAGPTWGLPVCWQFFQKLSIMCWIIRISILICNCDQCDWREWGEEGGKPWAISAPRVLHHRLHIRSDESKHRQVCALHSAPQHSHNWNVLPSCPDITGQRRILRRVLISVLGLNCIQFIELIPSCVETLQ